MLMNNNDKFSKADFLMEIIGLLVPLSDFGNEICSCELNLLHFEKCRFWPLSLNRFAVMS